MWNASIGHHLDKEIGNTIIFKIGCRRSISTLSGYTVHSTQYTGMSRNAGDSYSTAKCRTAKHTVATHKPTTFETNDWCYIGISMLPYPTRHPMFRCLLTDGFVLFCFWFWFWFSNCCCSFFFYFWFCFFFHFMFRICIYCFLFGSCDNIVVAFFIVHSSFFDSLSFYLIVFLADINRYSYSPHDTAA